MTILNREQAARRAEQSRTNEVGMCQKWVRDLFNAPSVGDVDRDGDSDAVDGWRNEPASKKHSRDRNPPRGVPLAWSGGSRGHGHRAISLGNRKVRSIDAGGAGKVATVNLDWFEEHWGMTYLGWSETISGIMIPFTQLEVPKATPPAKKPIARIVREVIDGKWGDGEERIKRLKKAGYNPEVIQGLVNKALK